MKDGSIRVRVESRIRGEEPIAFATAGRIFSLHGERVVSYLEKDENGVISSRLTLSPSAVSLERRGDGVLFRARFAQGEKSETLYYAGGVEFKAEILTKLCSFQESEDGIRLRLAYDMRLGEAEREVDFCLKANPKGEENDG